MKAVIQKVHKAEVIVDQKSVGRINKGLLIFLGVGKEDDSTDIEWLSRKCLNMRIFEDDNGQLNLSVNDIRGEIMVISQFTLFASTKKGNRPSFIEAARPEQAVPLYEKFVATIRDGLLSSTVATGVFGAHMDIEAHNDGPVTIVIDTKNKV